MARKLKTYQTRKRAAEGGGRQRQGQAASGARDRQAQAALDKAKREHDANAVTLEDERASWKSGRKPDARWEKQRAKLEKTLRQARQ